MLHLNHLVLLATSEETFHENNAPKHAFTQPCPNIPPRLTKVLGQRVALHGTWHGSWIVPLSSLTLDFVILRWHPETLEWLWQPLIGFPTLLPRNVSLAASKIAFVHLRLDHYTSPDDSHYLHPMETPVNDHTGQ